MRRVLSAAALIFALMPAAQLREPTPPSLSSAATVQSDAPDAHTERIEGIAAFPKWSNMLRRWAVQVAAVQRCIAKTGKVEDCVPAQWAALTARLRPLDRRAMLDVLNRAINRYPYVSAADNWGRADYWETPFEFMSRSGQCEDYAIAKFMILRAMGFADRRLRLVVVRDVVRHIDHAVLVVDLDGTTWLLDSVDDNVVPFASATRYRAYYAINETGWWLYTPNPLQLAENTISR